MDDTELQFCGNIGKTLFSNWKYEASEPHTHALSRIDRHATAQGIILTEISDTLIKRLDESQIHIVTLVTIEKEGVRQPFIFSTIGVQNGKSVAFVDSLEFLLDQRQVNRAISKTEPAVHFLILKSDREREEMLKTRRPCTVDQAVETLHDSLSRQFPQGISLDRCQA